MILCTAMFYLSVFSVNSFGVLWISKKIKLDMHIILMNDLLGHYIHMTYIIVYIYIMNLMF